MGESSSLATKHWFPHLGSFREDLTFMKPRVGKACTRAHVLKLMEGYAPPTDTSWLESLGDPTANDMAAYMVAHHMATGMPISCFAKHVQEAEDRAFAL